MTLTSVPALDSFDMRAIAAAVALVAGGLFAWLSVRSRWLTTGGAMAAVLLGLWVVYFAGPVWLVPLLFFFGSSTLLGKWLKPRITSSDIKQGRPRDAVQVLCNGLPYGLLATWMPFTNWNVGAFMLFSMAIATADTWSSEIGIAVGGPTRDIIGFKRISPGRSGGISLVGSLGGVAGALTVGLLGVIMEIGWSDGPLYVFPWLAFTTATGCAGMLLDSVLGSLLQARYTTADGGIRPLSQFRIEQTSYQMKSKTESFSAVAVALGHDAEDF